MVGSTSSDGVPSSRSTASGVRFFHAEVGGVYGLVVLPDGWNSDCYSLNAVNDSYVSNVISPEDWSRYLEPGGAVFLPRAGVRTISGVIPYFGYYTSSVASASAWCLTEFGGFSSEGHRGDGLSVRLVRDVE